MLWKSGAGRNLRFPIESQIRIYYKNGIPVFQIPSVYVCVCLCVSASPFFFFLSFSQSAYDPYVQCSHHHHQHHQIGLVFSRFHAHIEHTQCRSTTFSPRLLTRTSMRWGGRQSKACRREGLTRMWRDRDPFLRSKSTHQANQTPPMSGSWFQYYASWISSNSIGYERKNGANYDHVRLAEPLWNETRSSLKSVAPISSSLSPGHSDQLAATRK